MVVAQKGDDDANKKAAVEMTQRPASSDPPGVGTPSPASPTVLHYAQGRLVYPSAAVPLVLAGLAYGGTLDLIGILAMGAGHGCYLVLGLASSPLGLLNNVVVALIGTPVIWALIGALAGSAARRNGRVFFLTAMACHYLALPNILMNPRYFGDWSYIQPVKGLVTFGFVVYAVGQIVLWVLFWIVMRWKSNPFSRA